MTRLITEVKPDQLVSYGSLKVAFYDNQNPDYNEDLHDPKSKNFVKDYHEVPKHVTYIHILNGGDDRSIVKREVKTIRVLDGMGGNKLISEKEFYKTAYAKYEQLKNAENASESEVEALKRRIKELEEKSKPVEAAKGKTVKKQITEDSVKDKPLGE
jgi:hypothetical protein